MSIYDVLGHKIVLLEKHVEHLRQGNVIAREALEEILAMFEEIVGGDVFLREKYAHLEAIVKKALEESKD